MLSVMAVLMPVLGQGAWTVGYSSTGVDRYADGTPVADGECYALVFTKQGCAFSGFKADGSLVNPDTDSLAVVMPLAKDGRCPATAIILPDDYIERHGAEPRAVYLLDTRRADGRPAGLVDGRLARVNRFSAVPDGRLTISQNPTLAGVPLPEVKPQGLTTDSMSDVRDVPAPIITAVRVEGDMLVVRARQTVGYVTYGLLGGAVPQALTASVAEKPEEGNAAGEIELRMKITDKARFANVAGLETIKNREVKSK